MLDTKKPLLHIFRSALEADASMLYEHHHTAFEITMILSGSGIYATKAYEYEFKKGDIFFFGTNEAHWITSLNEKTDFLNIHFEPRYVWSDSFGASVNLTGIFLNSGREHHNRLDADTEAALTVKSLLFRMEKEEFEKKKEYEVMEKLLLFNILVEAQRACDSTFPEEERAYGRETVKCIERALAYTDAHLTEDLTLDVIADVAHMSKNYFCRRFKELNGISPWEYITVKRIERAIEYLKNTNLTKLEIAALCGYNSTANFYYAFKRVTGKAPSDYMKNLP